MPRPTNKPANAEHTPKPTDTFTLPAPIDDPELEMLYLLGHARGKLVTADRIAELYLQLRSKWRAGAGETAE